MRILFIIIISLATFIYPCYGQTKLRAEYFLPTTFAKPNKWLIADKERLKPTTSDTAYEEIIVPQASQFIPRALNIADYLGMLQEQNDFYTFLVIKEHMILQYNFYFPYLINLLTDTTKVGLSNIDYPLIFEDSSFLADTLVNKENLTTVAGRAECILNELTGENFAIVTPQSTMTELKHYQDSWVKWIEHPKQ